MVDEYTSRICSEFSVDTSDQVSKANAMLKRDRSYVKAVLDEKSSTLSNLTRYESYCVPDLQQANKQLQLDESSLESAKREMNSAVREYENAQRQEAEYQRKLYEFNQVTSLDPGQDAIERTRTSLDELRCKGKSLECTLLGLEKDEQTVHDRLTNVEQRTGFVKGSLSLCSKDGLSDCQDGTCPYTRKHCKELDEAVKGRVDHVAKLNDRLKALEDERKSVEQEIESVRRMARDVRTELRNVSEAAAKLESDLSRMRKLHESALQAHRPERTSESTTDSILSDLKNRAAEACDRVNDLRARVEKSRNAVKSASMLEELYGQRDELEGKYDVLGSWIKLTGENGLQSSLASKQFEKVQEAITESVKSLFGDEAECFFDVRNKANSFSFGVKREGKYVPYNLLSTGERCLLSLAFMRYICANSDSPLKVILVDDMLDNLDDGNFKKAIAYIEQCTDVQIIAAGVLPVKSELVNVIEL